MFSILAQRGGRFACTSHGNLSESHKQHADTPKQGLHSPQMFLNLDESQSNWHCLKRARRPFGFLAAGAEGIIRELVGIGGLSNPNLHIDSTIISLVFKSDYMLQLKEASAGSFMGTAAASQGRGFGEFRRKGLVCGVQKPTNCPGGSGGTVES